MEEFDAEGILQNDNLILVPFEEKEEYSSVNQLDQSQDGQSKSQIKQKHSFRSASRFASKIITSLAIWAVATLIILVTNNLSFDLVFFVSSIFLLVLALTHSTMTELLERDIRVLRRTNSSIVEENNANLETAIDTQAEQSNLESYQILRSYIEDLPSAIIFTDHNYKILEASSTAKKQTRQALIGKNIEEVLSINPKELASNKIKKTVKLIDDEKVKFKLKRSTNLIKHSSFNANFYTFELKINKNSTQKAID